MEARFGSPRLAGRSGAARSAPRPWPCTGSMACRKPASGWLTP